MDHANSVRERAAYWVTEAQQPHFAADMEAQTHLSQWLAESDVHATAFANAEQTFDRLEGWLARSEIDVGVLMQVHRAMQLRQRVMSRARHWLSVVAALTFGALLPLLPGSTDASPAVYATRLGEQQIITLEDGVELTLSPGTSVVVHGQGRFREIDVLRGETLFTLPEHPLRRVLVFGALGMVSGTARSFDIRQTEREFRVAAVRGMLSVLPIDSRHEVLKSDPTERLNRGTAGAVPLHTGDVAIIQNDRNAPAIAVENRSPDEMDQLIAWREGMLAFSNEPARTVVETFNRYNRRKLIIVDADIGELRLSGDFRGDDPDSFVLALEHLYSTYKILADRDPASGVTLLRREKRPAARPTSEGRRL